MTQAVPGAILASGEQGHERVDWQLADEMPVSIIVNTTPFAVMMASPRELEDFATGFAVAEEIVVDLSALNSVQLFREGVGWRVCLDVDPDQLGRGLQVTRGIAGRSSCGMCGIVDVDAAIRHPKERLSAQTLPSDQVVLDCFARLPEHQSLNALTHSVHAAAFCGLDGEVLHIREDVGRHNALDKLIGAVLREGRDPATGFVLMTSRCSFELVQKAVSAGFPVMAMLSAPTALALDLAHEAGVTIICRAARQKTMIFR